MAKKEKESTPKAPRKSNTARISDYKYMQYNGIQMSRKMAKLWALDKIAETTPTVAKKSKPKKG